MALLQTEISEVLAFAAMLTRRAGLSMSEMAALEHLQRAAVEARGEGGGLTPTQLGRRLGLSSGAITALVDRLERAGCAERRPNPKDRRSSVVLPKPEGLQDALRHMLPLREDLLAAASDLTDEERAVVGRYLEVITEILGRHARG